MNFAFVPLSHHRRRVRKLWTRSYRLERKIREIEAQVYTREIQARWAGQEDNAKEVYKLEDRVEELWSELEDVKQQRDRLYVELQEERGDHCE